MASLAAVFRVLNNARAVGVIAEYAIGGATAVLFYAEPARTYDLDVFVLLPDSEGKLAPLAKIYEWASNQGFSTEAEHIIIEGVPVQFLPAPDELTVEAVRDAREADYDGVAIRVIDPDYLVALALQAGGARRRERAWLLLQSGHVERSRLRRILKAHQIEAMIPDDV